MRGLFSPTDDELYAALLARDEAYEGSAWVGVTTTGIFCRLTCPARKPKRANTRFFESPAACLEAGFRPCQRCRPLAATGPVTSLVPELLDRLFAEPDRRWRETDLVALGHDPSTVRRAFKRHVGTTFLDLSRTLRLSEGGANLRTGARVIDAQLSAGFDSSSGFRDAFVKKLGVTPADLVKDAPVRVDWFRTPLGPMVAGAREKAILLLEFFDRKALPTELRRLRQLAGGEMGLGRFPVHDRLERELEDYFSGRSASFSAPLHLRGSSFQKSVWALLGEIPPGETRSYRDLAHRLHQPRAPRAVARANGANVLALIIPCHRVLGADGSLTGYGGGLWRKQWLLNHEKGKFQ